MNIRYESRPSHRRVGEPSPIDFGADNDARTRARGGCFEHLRDLVRAHPRLAPPGLKATILAHVAENRS